MPENTETENHYTVACHDIVNMVEFSPFDWSTELIGIVTTSRITVGTCNFQDDPDEYGISFVHLQDFHHNTSITAFAWSPEASLVTIPKLIRFCTASSDNKLQFFSSDLKPDDITSVDAVGHTDYINDVTYEPDKGDQVASVSDDHTIRVWSTTGEQVMCLPLTSPGMTVRWLAQDPAKIMVGEKRGVISFYNLIVEQRIMSLDCGESPMLCADWCSSNLLRVAAVAGSHCFQFDTSRSSQPIDSRVAHVEGTRLVRWSKSHDHLLATVGSPGSQITVINTRTKQTLVSQKLQVATGISWHARLPLLASGGDKKVHFYLAEPIAK